MEKQYIKPTLTLNLTPVRMAMIRNVTVCAYEDVEQGEHSSSPGGIANLYSHHENQYGSYSENLI